MHSFDGTWYIMDLGSRYGTLLDGTKIEPKKYVPLEEGALLRLGAHRATMAPSHYGYYDAELPSHRATMPMPARAHTLPWLAGCP